MMWIGTGSQPLRLIDTALYKGDIQLFCKLLQIQRQKLKGSDKEKVTFSKLYKQDFKDIFV